MYRRIILLLLVVIATVCISKSYKVYDLNEERYINIEIKGEVKQDKVLRVPLGTTIKDVLDDVELTSDSDISDISLLDTLHNNQIININKKDGELISINSASLSDLSSLPGIGKSIAKRIIDYRKEYGSFIKLEDITKVSGISTKKYEKIKQYICL